MQALISGWCSEKGNSAVYLTIVEDKMLLEDKMIIAVITLIIRV